MRDTLVLNASFEPLSTVTLNRAVVLVLQDKAVVEQTHPELQGTQWLPPFVGHQPREQLEPFTLVRNGLRVQRDE